jgi:hypothetical protein
MWSWFVVFPGESLHAADPTASTRTAAALGTFVVIGAGAIGCYLGDHWGRTRTAAAMAVSGTCALPIGLTFGRPLWLVLGVGILWGVTVVADSVQFSAMVTELVDQAYVGTALTVQLAIGFSWPW